MDAQVRSDGGLLWVSLRQRDVGFLWGLRVWVKGWVVLWWWSALTVGLCAFASVWVRFFSSSFLGCGYNGYLLMVVGMRLVFMVIGADLVSF